MVFPRTIPWYPGFSQRGFEPVAMFDVKPELIGTVIRGVPVYDTQDLVSFLKEHPVRIGVIATPSRAAQQAAQALVDGGVRAIWNFAPMDLKVPENVAINNVHLTDSLLVLTYRLHQMELNESAGEADTQA